MTYSLKVNGVEHTVDVDGDTPLLWVLRDVIGLTGTKFGCGIAMCGACTVHVDGVARRSCVAPVETLGGAEITTIEVIGETAIGKELQSVWLEQEVVQCGYCQPGQIMSAAALLAARPRPSEADIERVMSGNLCRCGTYVRIKSAIQRAAEGIVAVHPVQEKRDHAEH